MRTFITYIAALVFPLHIFAQTNLTNAEKREFRLGVVNLLESYELTLPDNSEEAKYNFAELFENDEVEIYNDLLGLSKEKTLTFKEYTDIWYNNLYSSNVTIKDIRFGEIREDETHIIVDAAFDKYLQYISNCGIIFDSEDLYKADHKITATIVMDKESKRFSFRRIGGSIESEMPGLPQNYRVYECRDNEPRDRRVTANGVALQYNRFSQAFVDADAKLNYNDSDIALKVLQENDCGLYRFKYKHRRWRIKPKAEMSIGKLYDFVREDVNDMIDSEMMVDLGLELGFSLVSTRYFKMGLFTGGGVSKSVVNFRSDNPIIYKYNADAGADYDGDSYTRNYEVSNFKAKMELVQFYVPLYLDFDFRLSRNFSIYLQGGAKGYYTYDFKIKDISADLYTYGVYPQYGNLIMKDFAPNSFGNRSFALEEQEVADAKKIVLDVFGGMGFRLRLFGNLYLDAGAMYQMNVTAIYETDIYVGLNEPRSHRSALFAYTNKGGEQMKPLYNTFTQVLRKNIKPNVGLLLKF